MWRRCGGAAGSSSLVVQILSVSGISGVALFLVPTAHSRHHEVMQLLAREWALTQFCERWPRPIEIVVPTESTAYFSRLIAEQRDQEASSCLDSFIAGHCVHSVVLLWFAPDGRVKSMAVHRQRSIQRPESKL